MKNKSGRKFIITIYGITIITTIQLVIIYIAVVYDISHIASVYYSTIGTMVGLYVGTNIGTKAIKSYTDIKNNNKDNTQNIEDE